MPPLHAPAAPSAARAAPTGQPGPLPLLAEHMPAYHTATLMLRISGGMAAEPGDRLGLAYVVEQSLTKGTARHDARGFADALDALGATLDVYTGRQTWTLVVSALPEFLPEAVRLACLAVRRATFPADAVSTARSLAEQELKSLDDYPRGLLRRQMVSQAYGPVLGRFNLGTLETLARITPEDAARFWHDNLPSADFAAVVAGQFDRAAIAAALADGLGDLARRPAPAVALEPAFTPARCHLSKELEQEYMGISFPGVTYDHPQFTVEKVLLAVLSGGMSSRLFVEVREKLGLVYWVGAWHEQPRGLGMIHVGASTTPARCDQTFETLMREIARLERDLTEDELERAKIGLLADNLTTGAAPDRRAMDMLTDQFHLGRVVPADEKDRQIRAVTRADIQAYLAEHPRDRLSIVTVGPRQLAP